MRRPHIRLQALMSADGKISCAARRSPSFGSRYDRRHLQLQRSGCDAVVLGAQTLRSDDYPLQCTDAVAQAARQAAGKAPGIIPVVLSCSLKLSPQAAFLQPSAAPFAVLATNDGSDASAFAACPQLEIWRLGARQVQLDRLCDALYQRGVRCLQLEGGGMLNAQFLQANLVDDIFVTIAPVLLGGALAPSWMDGTGYALPSARRLQLLACTRVEQEIYCHYKVL